MSVRSVLLELANYDSIEISQNLQAQLQYLQDIEVSRSWLGGFFSDPYDVSDTLWDSASNEYNLRLIRTAASQNTIIADALTALNPDLGANFLAGFNQISAEFSSAIGASGGFSLSQYLEDISGFSEAFFGSILDLVRSQVDILDDALSLAKSTVSTAQFTYRSSVFGWDTTIAAVNSADNFLRETSTSMRDLLSGAQSPIDLINSIVNGITQRIRSLDPDEFLQLTVASRTVVWLFLEQLRLEFVPVFHGLQGRLAAQS